jgi:hypothetical protein
VLFLIIIHFPRVFLVYKKQNLADSLGPLVGPLAHLLAPTYLVEPDQVARLFWPGHSACSPSPSPLARALATELPSPPPGSIPTAPTGASRWDGVRSIDPATVHLHVHEILSIVSLCLRLHRLPHLGFRPWQPRASSRAAQPFPWRDLVLVRAVSCRRVISVFPWLGAVVAAWALPRHATVVPPRHWVSPLLCLLLSVSSWNWPWLWFYCQMN